MADGKRTIRWMPIVLGVSLAVNLAVVAAIGGAAWRHKDSGRGERKAGHGAAPYVMALPRETRRALRQSLRAQSPRAPQFDDMLIVLRAEQFDPDAAAQVLAAQRTGSLARQDAASAAWLAEISKMDEQARLAYADRLQALVERRNGPRKPRD